MDDAIVDKVGEVIWETSRADESTISVTGARIVAKALYAAGLLRMYPHLEVEGGWLIEVVGRHTCGAGPGSGAGHEPGCGSIPVAPLATAEHDAKVAAKTLRDVAAGIGELGDREVVLDLADAIERKAWAEAHEADEESS